MLDDSRLPMQDREVANARNLTGYLGAFYLILSTIILAALLTHAQDFADYDAYTMYINNIVNIRSVDWFKLEPLSNAYLWICYWFTLNVISANNLAHTILIISFPILLWASFRPSITPWPALLAVFGLFGPLLAFVTLRATPAYLLATWAVYEASARRPRAFLLLVLAFGFHFSAIMVLPPLLLLYFRDSLPRALHFDRPSWLLLAGILAVSVAANALTGTVLSYIEQIPFLSKYIVYLGEGKDDLVVSASHYVFFGISTIMLIAFLSLSQGEAKRLNIYVLFSFFIYLMLFLAASPVAAFRQTPFWIIPLIGALPWHRFAIRGPIAILFILACEAMFIVQLKGVFA